MANRDVILNAGLLWQNDTMYYVCFFNGNNPTVYLYVKLRPMEDFRRWIFPRKMPVELVRTFIPLVK